MKVSQKIIFLLTGIQIKKIDYKLLEKTREHRYKIVKGFDGDLRQLNSLHDSLEMVQSTVNDMLQIIDSELDVAVLKKEMAKK